jgi:hypothetical protein
MDLNPHGVSTVTALDTLDSHVYVGGSRGTVLILNLTPKNFEILRIISTLPAQPTPQPTPSIIGGSTPSPRPGTPGGARGAGGGGGARKPPSSTSQSRPRSSSATRMGRSATPTGPVAAAGGRASQGQPAISRKGKAKMPSSGWTGPGDRRDESLPSGVKASTEIKGMALLPVCPPLPLPSSW